MATRDFSATPLTSTTLEGGFLEMATALNAAEVNDTTAPNQIQLTVNTDNQTVSINATIPASFAVDASGNLTITATEYIGV